MTGTHPEFANLRSAWMLPRPAWKHCLRRVDAVPRQAIFLIEPAHNSHTRLAGTKIHLVFKVMLLIGSLSDRLRFELIIIRSVVARSERPIEGNARACHPRELSPLIPTDRPFNLAFALAAPTPGETAHRSFEFGILPHPRLFLGCRSAHPRALTQRGSSNKVGPACSHLEKVV